MGDLDVGTGILVALVSVAGGVLVLALALRLTARRGDGVFRYFSFAVLLSVVALVVSSGRSLVESYAMQGPLLRRLASPAPLDAHTLLQVGLLAQTNPVSSWTNRLCSSFLMLASLERIASYILRRNRARIAPHPILLLAFVMLWCTTVASPALFASQGSFTHEYVYTLVMGCAALLLSQREGNATVAATRNGLLVFLAISVALIPLRPTLVIDPTYTGGLLPGVPRLAGLAPHSVTLGMFAELALLCLYAHPLPQRWLNGLCWALGLCTLFLAQSKVSWLSFPICAACIFWMRGDGAAWRRLGDPRRSSVSLVIPLAVLGVTVGLGLVFIFSNVGLTIDSFFAGERGADLTSFTGRDRIWAIALEEWARHPLFGYGSDLFDETYRVSIRMLNAVDGHNQFIDTLARSGLVGATGLTLYVIALLVFSVKHARSSHGLSLALFLAIVFRSVSEVPLSLFRYGPEVLQHFLLLAILPGIALGKSVASDGAPGVPARSIRPRTSVRQPSEDAQRQHQIVDTPREQRVGRETDGFRE